MSVQKANADSLASIPLRQFDQSAHPLVSSVNDGDRPTTPQSYENPHSFPPGRSHSRYKHYNSRLSQQGKGRHHDWWIWEFIGIATSGLSLAAMIAVLVHFNDRKWPDLITINSMLSWTATFAKSAMLIPVTECISQIKWIWFSERDRDLADMEYFDEGSRGPWGSMRLLIRLRARHLGVLGAIVTLVALAFDPVVQEIIQHDSRIVEVNNKTAVVAASEFYRPYKPDTVPTMASFRSAPLPMKGAIYNGLFANRPSIRPYFSCSSGNCTWSNYSSLAVCSTCQNVTSQLRVNCTTSCDAKLPGGAALLGSNGTLMSTNASSDPVFFKNVSSKAHILGLFQNIAAFGQLSAKDASKIKAAECILYLCVHSYTSTFDNGEFNETILKTWPDLNLTAETISPERINEGNFYTVSGKKYGMTGTTFDKISEHLRILLEGTVDNQNNDITFSMDALQPIWDAQSFDDPINRTAATMTKVIRDGNNSDSNLSNGVVWEQSLYVTVRWWWLTLPVFLFLVTTLQLVLTILRTRRSGAGLWRSSPLALAFHGLDRNTYEIATDRLKGSRLAGDNGENLLNAAKGIRVMMIRAEDGIMKLTSPHEEK
ncbi:hypothetical protein B0O99DRAFT_645562 [Bisporella sp. PMI_857]|nr:hypothetical protein B0O99DRAFT_645562 [Bisporella sp. PMI_857]